MAKNKNLAFFQIEQLLTGSIECKDISYKQHQQCTVSIYIIFLVKYYIFGRKIDVFQLFFSSFVNKIQTSDRII